MPPAHSAAPPGGYGEREATLGNGNERNKVGAAHSGFPGRQKAGVTIKDLSGKSLLEKRYPGIRLPAGRAAVKLPPLSPAGLPVGTVAVEYELR